MMAKVGRWLAAEHPEITEPGQWTRQTCAAWVAAVDRMTVGDYVAAPRRPRAAASATPIAPRTKAHILTASRDLLPRLPGMGVDPAAASTPPARWPLPRSVAALIGTDPRVIADDVWAKLLWAGLNLEADDLPGNSAGTYYPLPLIRAVTLTWLFSGLRSDEIVPAAGRLRPLAARRRSPSPATPPTSSPDDAVCLLDVPVHKTGTAFTKPVDPLLGQAIEAWQAAAARPADHAGPQDRRAGATCCSPSAPSRSPSTTSTARSSRRCAPRPASPPRRPRQHHQPPGPLHDRQPALQRQGADDAVRAAGLARPPHPEHHPALREDHPEHADQGLHRRRLLRPQRAHHRGPHRPRRRHLRRRRRRRALAALRPRPRLLQLQLLRAVPAPDGLRPLRLLHPEGLHQSPAARSQGQPAADARRHPAHRRRTRRRRRRTRAPSTALLDRLADIPTPAGPHPARSAPRRPPPCCRSSPSDHGKSDELDKSDSTE